MTGACYGVEPAESRAQGHYPVSGPALAGTSVRTARPVIFEYNRTSNENVINQGLFYLDWLLDHRAEFAQLVASRLVDGAKEVIDWTSARRYDEYAVAQIDRSIELVRKRGRGTRRNSRA